MEDGIQSEPQFHSVLASRLPAAASREAALLGCTSVPDMFYLAGCRSLDGRFHLLLSL